MFLSHPGVQHFQSPREFCLQETFPKPCPTQENNPLQQFYQNSFLRSKAFCPRQPLQNAQVKQLPWVLTALSSCGLRFVEKKSETRRSLGRAWGKALEIGNCWGQQKCGKHRILGQSVVTCRCCSFSPFIRKMMKHVRNMFQLGSSTTCQRMLPGVATRVLGGNVIWQPFGFELQQNWMADQNNKNHLTNKASNKASTNITMRPVDKKIVENYVGSMFDLEIPIKFSQWSSPKIEPSEAMEDNPGGREPLSLHSMIGIKVLNQKVVWFLLYSILWNVCSQTPRNETKVTGDPKF